MALIWSSISKLRTIHYAIILETWLDNYDPFFSISIELFLKCSTTVAAGDGASSLFTLTYGSKIPGSPLF